ncbi:ArsS family sensor histidine kinase [Poseidonibacter antarcticus]|uniref:ArsS family sensor histidine kinase n=1 Tax=Poseidonibacter antarcticus TaxID=2478538 RepID=UPI000EF4720E|nr:ArsS family sensor histidine kinase [Poseidonibacter antarcticus]
MNINSITTKISLIFLFFISILLALFFLYVDYEKKQEYKKIENYYVNISSYLRDKKMDRKDTIKYLQRLSFTLENNHEKILDNAEVIFSKRGFELFVYKKSYYLHIANPFFRVLFKDPRIFNPSYSPYLIFIFLFLFLIFLYLWLIKSLQPLKELKNNISSVSNGNLSISCKSNKKDEIAEVSNEFDKAVRRIELLLNSRQLFLRTIMHELKTPIAKGRIVSELIDNEKQKNRMIDIFKRLDFLINDFSKVEQVVSKNYKIAKHNVSLSLILDDALNTLLLDNQKEKILLNINPKDKINADLSLISMVVKNLIDNALRYSYDGKIQIEQKDNELLFISNGKKLEKEFEEYFKPFHNDVKSKNHGMGLGLYIVKSILDMHDFDFKYEHQNDKNIFRIIT